jgi:hypothetical protein
VVTATDVNGNTSTCTSIVTVIDSIAPTQSATTATWLDTYVFSNDQLRLLECRVPNTVVVTATDVNGNTSTCTSIVTVIDSIAPNAICQDITAYLDSTGFVQISAAMINNGSNDNCAVDTIFHSMCDFFCENVGPNTVTLTVVDVNGNSSTCDHRDGRRQLASRRIVPRCHRVPRRFRPRLHHHG